MSEISSSLRVIPGPDAVSLKGMSATSVAADAPLAKDKDTPTTPNAGISSCRRFRVEACFVSDMSALRSAMLPKRQHRLCIEAFAWRSRVPYLMTSN
jgi:hypothetical protein